MAIAAAVVAGLGLAYYFVWLHHVQIPSESMKPTYEAGDKISFSRFFPDTTPKRGEVMIFHPPRGADGFGRECGARPSANQACPEPTPGLSEQLFIKRVVAVEGDELYFSEGEPIVNGEQLDGDWETIPCRGGRSCNLETPITIPQDHYFTLGDNVGASDDSRFWGPVPNGAVVAVVD